MLPHNIGGSTESVDQSTSWPDATKSANKRVCAPVSHEDINPFLPTVPTFAVRETDVSRHNGGETWGAPQIYTKLKQQISSGTLNLYRVFQNKVHNFKST